MEASTMTEVERLEKLRAFDDVLARVQAATREDGTVGVDALWKIAQTLEPFSEERTVVEKILIDQVRQTQPEKVAEMEKAHREFAALQVIQASTKEIALLDEKIQSDASGPDRFESFKRRFDVMNRTFGMDDNSIAWAEKFGAFLPEQYQREAGQYVIKAMQGHPQYRPSVERRDTPPVPAVATWNCPYCRHDNRPEITACRNCFARRPEESMPAASRPAAAAGPSSLFPWKTSLKVMGVLVVLGILVGKCDDFGNAYRHDHGPQNVSCWSEYILKERYSRSEEQAHERMVRESVKSQKWSPDEWPAFENGSAVPCPDWDWSTRLLWNLSRFRLGS
jgi:hypothetical protein